MAFVKAMIKFKIYLRWVLTELFYLVKFDIRTVTNWIELVILRRNWKTLYNLIKRVSNRKTITRPISSTHYSSRVYDKSFYETDCEEIK